MSPMPGYRKGATALPKLLAECTNLLQLSLNVDVQVFDMLAVIECCRQVPTITTLDMNMFDSKRSRTDFDWLAELLTVELARTLSAQNPHLVSLNLTHSKMPLAALSCFPNLTEIDTSNCAPASVLMSDLAELLHASGSRIETLKLYHSQELFGEAEARCLAPAMAHIQTLRPYFQETVADAAVSTLLGQCASLTGLDVSFNEHMLTTTVLAMVRALPQPQQLRTLNVSAIDDMSYLGVAELLRLLPNLQSLGLSNASTDDFAVSDHRMYETLMTSAQSLTALDVQYTDTFDVPNSARLLELVQSCPKLRVVDVTWSRDIEDMERDDAHDEAVEEWRAAVDKIEDILDARGGEYRVVC